MEGFQQITINGITYNLVTDEELEEIKYVAKLEKVIDDIHTGKMKTYTSEEYDAILAERYGE